MSLEITGMGLLSLIFKNLKNSPEKKAVTHHFGLFSNEVFENWIHNLSNIRNICAHHGRLWNRRITIPIALPQKTKDVFIQNKAIYPYKIYAALCSMVYVINIINPESTLKKQLINLLKSCPFGQLKEMGFPKNWELENFWKP